MQRVYPQKIEKYSNEEVYLSNPIRKELQELLELYYDEYPLSRKIQISQLCNMGLMMLASLSVDELKNVDNWYRRSEY